MIDKGSPGYVLVQKDSGPRCLLPTPLPIVFSKEQL